jgi:hypothetical protein
MFPVLAALLALGAVFGPEPVQDDVQLVQVGQQLLAVSGTGGATATERLRVRERLLRLESRGLVGVALTSDRLLAVRSGSGTWSELPLRVEERALPPGRYDILVDDRAILIVLGNRLVGFAASGGGWRELDLTPAERVRWRILDESVAAVLTTRRAIGFSSLAGFATVTLDVAERAPEISTQDRSVTLVTKRRVLVFTAGSGRWREVRRLLHF